MKFYGESSSTKLLFFYLFGKEALAVYLDCLQLHSWMRKWNSLNIQQLYGARLWLGGGWGGASLQQMIPDCMSLNPICYPVGHRVGLSNYMFHLNLPFSLYVCLFSPIHPRVCVRSFPLVTPWPLVSPYQELSSRILHSMQVGGPAMPPIFQPVEVNKFPNFYPLIQLPSWSCSRKQLL